MRIRVEPLTVARFATFGTIIEQDCSAPLQRFDMVHEHGGAARTPGFALITIETAVMLPLQIHQVEMHPHSAQTFLPLLGGTSLVFVCESDPKGKPDVTPVAHPPATGIMG